MVVPRGYDVVSVSEFIRGFGADRTKEMLASYRSVKDSATEAFLHGKAVDMELYDQCRTFIAIADDFDILGFVTLGIKCLSVPENSLLSGKTLKRMNINAKTGVAQSYLLGQLSRSAEAPKGFGNDLLDLAFDRLRKAKDEVGCRMVRLDCHDELVPYYTGHGFRLITRNSSGSLNQMMAFV